MDLKALLKVMIDKDGSDLFLTSGAPPSMKAQGRLMPMTDKVLPNGATRKIAYSIMNEEQIAEFEQSPEMNLALFEKESVASVSTSSSNATKWASLPVTSKPIFQTLPTWACLKR